MASSYRKVRSVGLLTALALAGTTTITLAQSERQTPVHERTCLFLQGHAEEINSVPWSGEIFRSMVVEADCQRKNYVINLEVTEFTVVADRSDPEIFDNAMARLSDNICSTELAELADQGWVFTFITRAGDTYFRPTVVIECP
ncbi:MAG: hypothetical protein Devi2KO_38120 [Devosia indica]